MKIHSLAAVFAVAIAALIDATPVSAAPPVDVVIHIIPNQILPQFGGPCPPFTCGVWDLTSSALNDSGTYQPGGARVAPPDRNPFTSGPLFEEFLLTSAQGNGGFSVKAEERLVGTFPNLTQVGVWQIEAGSGSGVYADASGHGDVSRTATCCPGILFLTLSGVISKT